MWYEVSSTGQFWVEVGFKDGENSGGGCVSDEIFWADSRNGGGYNEHYFSNSWTLGSFFGAEITSSGSCQWAVTLGGLNLGTSTANCPGSGRFLAAGIEASNQGTGSARGFLSTWEEQNGSGTWIGSWDGVVPPNDLRSDNPPNIEYLSSTETEEVHNEPF
jgi:hypothetical protein